MLSAASHHSLLDLLVQSLMSLLCLRHDRGCGHGCGHSKIFIINIIYVEYLDNMAQW